MPGAGEVISQNAMPVIEFFLNVTGDFFSFYTLEYVQTAFYKRPALGSEVP